MKIKTIVLFIIFQSFASCVSKVNLVKNTTPLEKSDPNEIVFLFFKINKDLDSKTNKVEFIKSVKSEGTIKNNIEKEIGSENYLTLEVYNGNTIVKTILMDHPLYKDFEYLDEKNNFQRKKVEVNSEEFSVRLQISGSNSSVKIYETLKMNPKKELLSLKL
jgi:hypothetical protein